MPIRLMLILIAILLVGAPAPAAAAAGEWQPGPDAALDNTYVGFIDQPVSGATLASSQSVTISGWVVDRAADGWAGIDAVHVYDGLAGQGGTFLGQATIGQSRPDVAQSLGNPFWGNSGFSLSFGASSLAAGPHTLTVYAHTPAKGWWFSQVSVSLSAIPPAPAPSAAAGPINVLVKPSMVTISKQQDHYTIKGYAVDPNASGDAGIDHVDLYMDEARGKGGGVFLGTAQLRQDSPDAAAALGTQFEMDGYQFDFKPVNFAVGSHHIYAYAVSSITGQETVAITGFDIGP